MSLFWVVGFVGGDKLRIQVESPRTADVQALIEVHVRESVQVSEVSFALEISDLDNTDITFLTARSDEGDLLGMAALKDHHDGTGELKSMRAAQSVRGNGTGSALLERIVDLAHEKGMTELNLETGVEDFFAPARRLYEKHGFVLRGPFADYEGEPGSLYYGLALEI